MSINIKPLEDRVIVKPIEVENTTASGLVLPDTAKEKPSQGEVVAIGSGKITESGEKIPMEINLGDTVLYSKYGGTELEYNNESYLVLSTRDILAIIA